MSHRSHKMMLHAIVRQVSTTLSISEYFTSVWTCVCTSRSPNTVIESFKRYVSNRWLSVGPVCYRIIANCPCLLKYFFCRVIIQRRLKTAVCSNIDGLLSEGRHHAGKIALHPQPRRLVSTVSHQTTVWKYMTSWYSCWHHSRLVGFCRWNQHICGQVLVPCLETGG